jgi:hypothetical protein
MFRSIDFRRASFGVCTAIVLAVMGSAAEPAAAADTAFITEPRNVASGFAITAWMVHVDALGTHCSTIEGGAGKQSMDALASWQKRNVAYVDAALKYMAQIEDFISAKQGEVAREQFHADRKKEFVQSTRKAEAVWFPDGKIDNSSCLNLASHANDGSYDLDKDRKLFPSLQELKTAMDRPAQK